MAKERRQFIGLTDQQAESFNGLPNEITVSTDGKTLRVHTEDSPHGVLLAKQSDLSSTSETVSQQGLAISGLDGRVTNLENASNGDIRGFTYAIGYLCNEANPDANTNTVYPYKDSIQCTHLTPQNHDTIAYMMFDPADAASGNFAPFADYDSASSTLTVYCKVAMDTTHYGRCAFVDVRRGDSNANNV